MTFLEVLKSPLAIIATFLSAASIIVGFFIFRRARVLVHRAFFVGGSEPYFFVNVTNLSQKRDVVVTHVWFDTSPATNVLNPERPLPKRLTLDEPWETWIPVSSLSGRSDEEVFKLARVKLSNGKVVKSKENKNVHSIGSVPGDEPSCPTTPDHQPNRPDVILRCRYLSTRNGTLTFPQQDGFYFSVENTGEHPAVNVTILPVVLKVPRHIVKQISEENTSFGYDAPVDTEWVIVFESIDHLTKTTSQGEATVHYRIRGRGQLQQNIATLLPEIVDNTATATLPLTVQFSDLAEPQKTWHAHYELVYNNGTRQQITCRFVGYGDCNAAGKCPRCV
jgi:hypothetical protein